MADANGVDRVTLTEGSRIKIVTRVYEGEGRVFKAGAKVKTNDKGDKFVVKEYMFPFVRGLVVDPLTEKKADENVSLPDMAKRIHEWMATLELLIKADGRAQTTLPNGKMVPCNCPVQWLPSLAGENGILSKGFKLAIQGKANLALMAEVLEAGAPKAPKAAKVVAAVNVESFG